MNEHHYSRIDAGQPRQVTTEPVAAPSGYITHPLTPIRSDIVACALLELADGQSLRQIAAHLDISYEGLRIWILRDQPVQYKVAQELGMVARLVHCDKQLDDAANPLDIARAREAARFARWDAERRLPHLFGQKQEVTHNIQQPIFSVAVVVQVAQTPVDNSVVAEQLPQCTTPDNIPKLT